MSIPDSDVQKYVLCLSISDIKRLLKKVKATKKPDYASFSLHMIDNDQWDKKCIEQSGYKLLIVDPIGYADKALDIE